MDSNQAWHHLSLNSTEVALSLALDTSGRVVNLASEIFSFPDIQLPIPLSRLTSSPYFDDHEHEILIRLRLRSLWFQTMGVLERPYLKKGRKREELLCRCAGIYSGDLEDVLRRDLQTTFEQMTQMTTAASTCMSCLDDVRVSWQKIRDQSTEMQTIDAAGRRYRPLNLVPAEFALLLQQELISWSQREQLPPSIAIEITGLVGLKVLMKVSGSNQGESYLKALEEYWRSSLGVRVQVAIEV